MYFQAPSSETTVPENGTASTSESAACSETSADGQQGRSRISQAEDGLSLDSSSAEAVRFQAEVVSLIDKVSAQARCAPMLIC